MGDMNDLPCNFNAKIFAQLQSSLSITHIESLEASVAKYGFYLSVFSSNMATGVRNGSVEIVKQMVLVTQLSQDSHSTHKVDMTGLHALDERRDSLSFQLIHDVHEDTGAGGI